MTTSPFSTTLKRREITHNYSRQLPDHITIILRYINNDFKNGVPLSFPRLTRVGLLYLLGLFGCSLPFLKTKMTLYPLSHSPLFPHCIGNSLKTGWHMVHTIYFTRDDIFSALSLSSLPRKSHIIHHKQDYLWLVRHVSSKTTFYPLSPSPPFIQYTEYSIKFYFTEIFLLIHTCFSFGEKGTILTLVVGGPSSISRTGVSSTCRVSESKS